MSTRFFIPAVMTVALVLAIDTPANAQKKGEGRRGGGRGGEMRSGGNIRAGGELGRSGRGSDFRSINRQSNRTNVIRAGASNSGWWGPKSRDYSGVSREITTVQNRDRFRDRDWDRDRWRDRDWDNDRWDRDRRWSRHRHRDRDWDDDDYYFSIGFGYPSYSYYNYPSYYRYSYGYPYYGYGYVSPYSYYGYPYSPYSGFRYYTGYSSYYPGYYW